MISTAAELTAALESLSYVDWINIGQFVYFLGEQFFGLPDPLTSFLSIFSGRPTMQATVDIAHNLHLYSSPTLQMLAAGAANSLAHGVPLSSSEGDPYFGPYFGAALQIEEGIRWSRSDASTQAVETNTLAQVLHEAGNPGVAGDATILAVQTAWNNLKAGRPQGGYSPDGYFGLKAVSNLQDKTSGLVRGFSQSYLSGNQPSPTPTPPPHPTPPPTTTPTPAPTGSLTWSIPQNQTFHGDFNVEVTVEGGPFPAASVYVYLDGEIWTTHVAGTTTATQRITIPVAVSVQNLVDGLHALQGYWLGQHGETHAESILHWQLQRQSGPPPTTPPPPSHPTTTPPPVAPCHISFNFISGEEISGSPVPLTATVQGGPHNQARLLWTFGSHQIANIPAPTITGTTPQQYTAHWDTTPYLHQTGIITAAWTHADGSVICSVSASIGIGVNPSPTPTPPPPTTTPPPGAEPPTNWEQCCKEIVDALTKIADELGATGEGAQMKALVTAVQEIVTALGKTGILPETLTKIYTQQVKHDDGELASKELLDQLVNLGMMDPNVGQLLGDPYPVRIHPNPTSPTIAKWLRGHGIEVKDDDRSWADSIIRWIKALLEWIEKETTPFFTDAAKDLAPWVKGIEGAFGTLFKDFAHLDTILPKTIFDWVTETITNHQGITPDNVETVALDLFGGAFLVGQAVHILKEFVGFLKYPASSVWKENAELLVEMLAYKEILHSFHNAFYSTAITVRAKQKYQRQFRPHIPSYSEGHHAFARGKLDANGRNGLDALNGLDPAYTAFMQALAYRPISAFMLARGFRNNAPASDLLQQVITDQGVDPRFHPLVEQIIDDACYQHLFDTYTSASLQATAAGAMTLQDLDDNLKASNWDVKARNIARQIALIQRQEQIAKQAETAAQTELAGGFITEAQARALMEGAGIDSWRVDTVTAIANARAALTAERRIQTEEQRQLKAGLAAAFKGLAAQYQAGDISEVALIAALEATLEVYLVEYQAAGATPQEIEYAARFGEAEVLALVAQAKAKLDGSQVLKYGKLMSREQGQLLELEVAAIREAVIRLDESLPNARNRLLGLGLPQTFVNALIERWDAQIQAKGAAPP